MNKAASGTSFQRSLSRGLDSWLVFVLDILGISVYQVKRNSFHPLLDLCNIIGKRLIIRKEHTHF